MSKTVWLLPLIGSLVVLAGCELFNTAADVVEEINYGSIRDIRYSQHVQPLLAQKCTRCHSGAAAAAGLRLDTWEHAIAGSDFGEVLIPFDAENSLLIELAAKLDPPHPAGLAADTLTQEEIDFLARWIDEGARNDEGTVPYAGSEQRLYVANQDAGTISVIDMTANVVIRTVKLADFGFTGTPKPHHVGVSPDGAFWYVSLIGANAVLQFDRENRLVGQTDSFETPGMIAVHPDGDRVYAGRSLSNLDPPRSIGVLQPSDLALEEIGVFFERPHALRVSPDGRTVYTASLNTNQIAAIDVATQDVELSGFPDPRQSYVHFAISPDSRTLYATGDQSGQLSIIDASQPDDLALVATLAVQPRPWHPTLTPDGRRLYFGNKGANAVTVVDTVRREVIAVVRGAGLAQPHGAAASPDGRYVYISNNNNRGDYAPRHRFGANATVGTVVVIDTATNTIVKVLEVGTLAAGMDAQR